MRYMSPEQAEGASATPASDVFSFGLILYELLEGRPAVAGVDGPDAVQQIRTLQPGVFADAVPEPFSSLLRQMLVRAPEARTITMSRIEAVLKVRNQHDDAT